MNGGRNTVNGRKSTANGGERKYLRTKEKLINGGEKEEEILLTKV